MSDNPDITRQLRRELDETRLRLAEAEETLDAIRNGEVDGLVVAGPNGQQVFTLQGAQEPYRMLVEQMSEGALTLSRDGVILYANQAFARMLQMPPGHVIGAALRDFLPAADQPAVAGLIETALNGSSSGEGSIHAATGSTIPLRLGLRPMHVGAETVLCAVAVDITLEKQREIELLRQAELLEASVALRTADLAASRIAALNLMEEAVEGRQAVEDASRELLQELTERKRAEDALTVEREKLQAAIDNTAIGFVFSDGQGGNIAMNAAALRFHGFSSTADLVRRLEDYANDWELQYADGRQMALEEWPLARATRGDFVSDYEAYVYNRRTGGRWIGSYTAAPVRGSAGGVTLIVMTILDVTEQRGAAEAIRQLNLELEQRVEERTAALTMANEELETFSYSVSHDLRAPLRSIDGFSRIVFEDFHDKLDAEGRDNLTRIRAATQHMGKLIDDLLSLARVARTVLRRERVDLSALAQAVIAELPSTDPGRTADFVVQDNLMSQGDPSLLRVVLENLLGNAWKFTGKRDAVRIEFGARPQDGQTTYFVRDNGAGFDPAYAGKLFGPFQRLHSTEEFPGTGIGLATAQRIIRRHRGRIWAEGEVNLGATFFFTLDV